MATQIKEQKHHSRGCDCDTCKLAQILQRIEAKCTNEEKAALETLWNRMEAAETEVDWNIGKARDNEIISIDGHLYMPECVLAQAIAKAREEMLENL